MTPERLAEIRQKLAVYVGPDGVGASEFCTMARADVNALLAEAARGEAVRAAALALVHSLPRCSDPGCPRPATLVDHVPFERSRYMCPEHVYGSCGGAVEWAAPMARLTALLAPAAPHCTCGMVQTGFGPIERAPSPNCKVHGAGAEERAGR